MISNSDTMTSALKPPNSTGCNFPGKNKQSITGTMWSQKMSNKLQKKKKKKMTKCKPSSLYIENNKIILD